MKTFNFYSISEKTPKHNEDIILLRHRTVFDSEGFEPIHTSVEYQWAIIDSDGDDTGSAYCYEECDPEGIDILENEGDSRFTIKLEMLCDNEFRIEPKDFWMSRIDYIGSFGFHE